MFISHATISPPTGFIILVQPVHSGAQTAQNDTAAPIQEVIKPIQQVIQSIQQVVDQTIQKVEPTEMRKKKNNTALQRLVDDMLHADEDKPYSKIDWGKQMNGTNDESPNPLVIQATWLFEIPYLISQNR